MDNLILVILIYSCLMIFVKIRLNVMNMVMMYVWFMDYGFIKIVFGIVNFVNVRKNMFFGEIVMYIIVDGSWKLLFYLLLCFFFFKGYVVIVLKIWKLLMVV